MAGNTMDDMIFNTVSELIQPVNGDSLEVILSSLKKSLEDYERSVLKLKVVRKYLYCLYNERIRSGHAITKLSRDFNKSKRGEAAKLAKRIEVRMKAARALEPDQAAAEQIQKVHFDFAVLMGDEVLSLVRANQLGGLAISLHENVKTLQHTLYGMTIRLAVKIAKEQRAPLSGDVVDYADLFQQATIELERAIRKYVPRDTDAPVRAFTSYISNTVRYNVSHRVAEQSRTVAIPRTLIDRFQPILLALKDGYLDYGDLAKRATQIIAERHDGKIPSTKMYTEAEVYYLIATMQESDSLDAEVATDENGQPATLGDRIEDTAPSPEQSYDVNHVGVKLMSIVKDYCTDIEFAVMDIRWGSGKVRGLKDTADIFRETMNRPMNKTRVASIEADILDRLRVGSEEGDERLLEIRAVLEDM